MTFSDTYHHEVLQSRRDRSRRAFFWARIVGLALMLTIGATLRAEPELRALLLRAGMDGVTSVANLKAQSVKVSLLSQQNGHATAQSEGLPTARIRINRPRSRTDTPQIQDTANLANDVARSIAERQSGN